jgi:hypothetical protein
MQTGTVLYLTDSQNVPEDLDETFLIEGAGLEPRWTVLADAGGGYLPVEDAVHRLIVRGAHRVEAVTCRVTDDGTVDRFGDPLRIYG